MVTDRRGAATEGPTATDALVTRLDAAHPALATLAEVAERVRRERERVERQLACFG